MHLTYPYEYSSLNPIAMNAVVTNRKLGDIYAGNNRATHLQQGVSSLAVFSSSPPPAMPLKASSCDHSKERHRLVISPRSQVASSSGAAVHSMGGVRDLAHVLAEMATQM